VILDFGVEAGDRLVVVFLQQVGAAPVVIGRRQGGCEAKGFRVVRGGLVVIVFFVVGGAALEVGGGVLGVLLEVRGEARDGLVVIFFFRASTPSSKSLARAREGSSRTTAQIGRVLVTVGLLVVRAWAGTNERPYLPSRGGLGKPNPPGLSPQGAHAAFLA
jgi:hypothetical protein